MTSYKKLSKKNLILHFYTIVNLVLKSCLMVLLTTLENFKTNTQATNVFSEFVLCLGAY